MGAAGEAINGAASFLCSAQERTWQAAGQSGMKGTVYQLG